MRSPGCVVLPRVSSTLDVIHELAADGAPAGTLVIADEQVRGRGRQGRTWVSPPGAGIWMSWLVRPAEPLQDGMLALRVGLAVAETLEHLGVATSLKWPNDILVEGRKLAGILCEGRWQGPGPGWVGVGIGMNVCGPLPAVLAGDAVTVQDVAPGVGRVAILETLVPALQRLSTEPVLTDGERDAYARRDWLRGRRIVKPRAGLARGIDADGALLVETPDGLTRIAGGHVVPA